MTKHVYFVSYSVASSPNSGEYYPRNKIVELEKPILSVQDIRDIEFDIIEFKFGKEYRSVPNLVVINNWIEVLR